MRRLTKEEFIKKAREIHGDKYNYSKVEYINNKIKVCIVCPEHGEFWMKPNSHLLKQGCPKCAIERNRFSQRCTLQEFIKKAREIHGDKYNYSKVEYINNRTKICIICPKHGEFWQRPGDHLQHKGCPKCANDKIHSLQRLTKEQFIGKAIKIHSDKYSYAKVMYTTIYDKICIVCPIHGEFWQTPHDHLKQSGCPKCNQSHMEKETEEILLNKGIKYETQKRFEWLGKQSLDFYLPDYNIAIECQGEQHFKPVDFAGKGKEWAEFLFKKNIKRDKNKLKLCEEKQINLFYINYNENILEKINKIISD